MMIKANPVSFQGSSCKSLRKKFPNQRPLIPVDVADMILTTIMRNGSNPSRNKNINEQFLDGKQFKKQPICCRIRNHQIQMQNYSKGWINLANLESGAIQQAHALALGKVGEYHDYTVYLQPNLQLRKV